MRDVAERAERVVAQEDGASAPAQHVRRARLAALAFLGALSSAATAHAVETPYDVETDHVAAFDDGGPRSVGIVVDVPTLATAMLGAELDVAFGEHVVLDVEAGARWLAGTHAYRASVGALLFPQRFAFHGLYVHPFGEWGAEAGVGPRDAIAATSVGGGATVGYAWTWAFGATARFGAGIVYARREFGGEVTAFAVDGLRPKVDGAIGWVF